MQTDELKELSMAKSISPLERAPSGLVAHRQPLEVNVEGKRDAISIPLRQQHYQSTQDNFQIQPKALI